MRLFILLLAIELYLIVSVSSQLSYSFPIPDEFGKMSYKDAGCCELLTYPQNDTSPSEVKYPSFVGLGVMKSGTSTLFHHMRMHPDFFGSNIKEVHFLDYDSDLKVSDYLKYWNTSENAEDEARLKNYEVTPTYLWVPISACRAQYIYPDMKFVIILRDQITRSFSHFNFDKYWCNKNAKSPSDCDYVSDYLKTIKSGIKVMKDSGCDFGSGHPLKSWNDCYKCMAWFGFGSHKKCGSNVFFTKNQDRNKDICILFGEVIISMNMYTPQIAWWFNFFKPEQFYFINSDSFELASSEHFGKIAAFVGDDKEYIANYNNNGKWKLNKGKYLYEEDESNNKIATELLLDFFDRPNKELVQLLYSTGHSYFEPFKVFEGYTHKESILQSISRRFDTTAWNFFLLLLVMCGIFVCVKVHWFWNILNFRLNFSKQNVKTI